MTKKTHIECSCAECLKKEEWRQAKIKRNRKRGFEDKDIAMNGPQFILPCTLVAKATPYI